MACLFNCKKEMYVPMDSGLAVTDMATQTLAVLGQYDLWVQRGAVSLMGAILHAGSTAHRVHAPSTHALPIIRCVPDPFSSTNRQTEIQLIAYENGFHLLRQVSTRFGGIWNDSHTRIEGLTSAAHPKARSFALVSFICCC